MGTTTRARENFLGGLIENMPLTATDTILSSEGLLAMGAYASADPEYIALTLDPDGLHGPPEIVWVTAHGAGTATATILRAQEGTEARIHPQDTPWVHSPTVADFGADGWTANNNAMRLAGHNISGGGVVTWSGNALKWTARFIVISTGRGSHFSSIGHYDVDPPAVGTVIPGYGGASSFTVATAGVVTLTNWDALYAVFPAGGGAKSPTLALVNWTGAYVVPDNWVLIAVKNGDDGRVRLGTGQTLDYWHVVGAAGQPAFQNGWVNYGLGYTEAAFYKDTEGFVHLRGLIKSGTLGAAAFTLPAGYRHAVNGQTDLARAAQHLVVQGNGAAAIGFIRYNGEVVPQTTNTWYDLAGAAPFLAEA